jgi:hypothetical protein
MPKLYSPDDMITRITGLERGKGIALTSDAPKFLVIRAVSNLGPQEVLISESAALQLRARLTDVLPADDSL